MRRFLQLVACLALVLASPGKVVELRGASPKFEQNQVEVAMTLQLANFTSWERKALEREGKKLRVGVFEDGDFFSDFQFIASAEDYAGTYEVVLVDADASDELLAGLDILFFSGENRRGAQPMIERLKGKPALLVGKFNDFLEMGGMVNFIKKGRRVSFEVDLANAKKSGISFRAKFLRLARRVLGNE